MVKMPKEHAKKKEYNTMTSTADKNKIKREWAIETFAYVLVEKTFEESYKEVDEDIGEMMTFGGVVMALGGWQWKPAIIGAARLCGKCARMGGKWAQYDEWSGLMHFLKVKHMHKAVMDKKWSVFTKWSNEPMKVEDVKKNDESGEGGGKAGAAKAVKAMAATKAKTAAAKAAATGALTSGAF